MSFTPDEKYMHRCFTLALNGMGSAAPNPLVGAVVVYQDRIIGEGWHQKYGSAHAEVNAVASVTDTALLPYSTLYVNLEPCSHFGKTPPCCDLIIKSKIPRVVISTLDPNPKVIEGNSIKKMQNAGIEVITNVLNQEGYELNRRFFTFHLQKRPYIILKWAQTLDGFMDIDRTENPHQSYWITNQQLKNITHKWRSEEQAIMVGRNTVQNDNPRLNVREWKGQNPVRIIIDKENKLDKSFHCFDGSQPTLVYTASPLCPAAQVNWEYVKIDFSVSILPQIMSDLYLRNISSVIIEGGKYLLESFIEQNLWDEARVLIGNKTFIKGLQAPRLSYEPVGMENIADNVILYYKNIL